MRNYVTTLQHQNTSATDATARDCVADSTTWNSGNGFERAETTIGTNTLVNLQGYQAA